MLSVTSTAPLRRLHPRLLASVAAVAGVVVLLAVLPRVVGTSWNPVGELLGSLPVRGLLLLLALWFAGLVSYSWVLTSSLPGLSTRRALLLNLSGSAVANVAPFGGAAGVGMNFAMVRSWRFTRSSFATFTVVSNLWDWLGKLVVAGVVLTWVLATDVLPDGPLSTAVESALVVLALVLSVVAVALTSARAARATGALLDRAVWFRPTAFGTSLPELRASTVAVARERWVPLTGGVVGYLLLQAVLLGACLHLLGSDLAPAAVLAGFAVERLLTLVPLTPGGAGFADAACATMLVALGGDPVVVAAAVLLYRGFTFLLEIPVGGLGILGWLLAQRRSAAVAAAA
jgi:uncharacterized membrane protein YbhN (UPF0104 family)